MDAKEKEKMLNLFSDPDYGNSHDFSIRRKEGNTSFSEVALDEFRQTLFMYIGGRIMAYWQKTGKAPNELNVHIDVDVK